MIKSNKAVLCFFALFMIILSALGSVFNPCENESFSPTPSHIVLSKWYGKNGRRKAIINTDFEKETLYKTTLSKIPSSQTKLILKTDNLKFSLYTNGKIIFSNLDKRLCGYGKFIHIIDISDLKSGSELYLIAKPVKDEKARILSDIYLTSTNDFLLDLICKSAKAILVFLLILILAFISVITGIIRLLKKKKTAPRAIYLSCCLFICNTVLVTENSVFQFFINSDSARYLMLYSAYSLLGVFISSYLCSLMKIKSKAVIILNILTMIYTVLRALLFIAFLNSLSKLLFISNIILMLSILLPIIIKLFRKIRKSFLIIVVYEALFSRPLFCSS